MNNHKYFKIFFGVIIVIGLIIGGYAYFKTNVKVSNTTFTPTPTTSTANINLEGIKEVSTYYGKIKLGVKPSKYENEYTVDIDTDIHDKTTTENLYLFDEKSAYFGLLFRSNIEKSDFDKFKVIGFSIKFNNKNYDTCIMQDSMNTEKQNADGTISKIYYNVFYKNKIMIELQQLKRDGGSIEINSIITTVKDNKNEGGFDNSLNEWGKVYHTYEEITQAREWNNTDQFKQFFSKKYFFKGNQS